MYVMHLHWDGGCIETVTVDRSFWARTPLNAAMNITRTVVMALIGVFLVPFYIDNLGLATYGIIPLATTMTSYVMIIADSLESACSRYSTLAINRSSDASKELSTGFFGILRTCIVLIPPIVLVSWASPYIFGVAGNSHGEVQIMFLLIMIASLLVVVGSAFSSVFNANNTLYQIYLARLAYTVLQVGLIFALFAAGDKDLISVGLAYLVSSAFLLALLYVLAKRDYPPMRIRFRYYDKALFRSMGTLGVWSVIYKIGNMLYIQASLVIINIYIGAEAEGGFAIVSSLISMIHTACYSVTTSFEPLVYHYYAEKDGEGLRHLLVTGVKFVSLLFAMPVAFIMVFAPQVIEAWVGADYVYLADVVRIALAGDVAYCAATVLQSVPTVYLKVNTVSLMTVIFGIVNVAVSAAVCMLSPSDNFAKVEEAPAVWLVCTRAYTLCTMAYVGRITGTGIWEIMRPLAIGYAFFAASGALMWLLSGAVDVPGEWIPVIGLFLALFAVYVPTMFAALDSYEKGKISSFLPSSLKRLFGRFLGESGKEI